MDLAEDTRMQIGKEEINVKGTYIWVNSVRINDKIFIIPGKMFKVAQLKEEWYEDVRDPEVIIEVLKTSNSRPDIFTFFERFPNIKPQFSYHMEWEENAVLPIRTFDYWWHKQIVGETRNRVRKAYEKGVVTKVVCFNEELALGIANIFNETPVRQGKSFWHYGKPFETIRRDMARDLDRSEFIGAYCGGELIGFMKLIYADSVADPVQFISMIRHRDKSPNNALMAKAVEVCEKRKISLIVFGEWRQGSYAMFLMSNGFEKMSLPRYYIPLTDKGKLILQLRLHHGLKGLIPPRVKRRLMDIRSRWYKGRYRRFCH